MQLHLRVLFFDIKTDYLPYYKNFTIDIDKNNDLKSILLFIKQLDRNFDYPNDNIYLRVNSLVTSGETLIKNVVGKLGNNLTIEPISSYRVTNDLIIDDSDFEASFELLKDYTSNEDKEYYNKLYGLHYASATFEYNRQYVGDAILLLASRLIFNKHPKRDEILEIITQDNGLWDAEWENNMLDDIDYESTFKLLKTLAKPNKDKNRVSSLFTRKYKNLDLSSYEEIGVAFYYGIDNYEIYELSSNVLEQGYKEVKFKYAHKSCGISLLETNEELALKKAARVLLDAYDSGASILLTNKKYVIYFKENIGKIERVANRDILINIVDIEEFSL